MATLTVTARGQVTLPTQVLQHLGLAAGDKIEVDLLPDGRVALAAARHSGTIDGFLGLLAGKATKMPRSKRLKSPGERVGALTPIWR